MGYCDLDDGPSFYHGETIKARKQHKCCECSAPILNGEEYYLGRGVWDGEWSTFKQHMVCKEACTTVRDRDGECLPFGGLREHITEHYFWNKHVQVWTDEEKKLRGLFAKVLWRHRPFRKRKNLEARAKAAQGGGGV